MFGRFFAICNKSILPFVINTMSIKIKYARIREEIWLENLSVPVGDGFYGSRIKLPYRWIGDETFQVFYKGKWQNAESIDWEFIN